MFMFYIFVILICLNLLLFFMSSDLVIYKRNKNSFIGLYFEFYLIVFGFVNYLFLILNCLLVINNN